MAGVDAREKRRRKGETKRCVVHCIKSCVRAWLHLSPFLSFLSLVSAAALPVRLHEEEVGTKEPAQLLHRDYCS